ncbi:MAG: LysM peptidoglycan-binding domain-containing protein [Bacteroidales bacterium]|nr:LysM peptidoglycan-binding domain-containing protein [Bacteroidales bacterium]
MISAPSLLQRLNGNKVRTEAMKTTRIQGVTLGFKQAAACFMVFLLMAAGSVDAQEETRKHTVQALENYYTLSLKYDISIDALKQANPGIANPGVGDVLVIPGKSTMQAEPGLADCARLRKEKNELYRVALMVPFSLEQVADSLWKENLDPLKINELSPFRFIQFYHGFMLAADSLRQKGLNVEIHVYDIDHQTSKAMSVIHKPELKKMDLIFGPLFKNSFSIVAEFALENNIPVINPLSPRNDILEGNPFVFKLLHYF